MSEPLDRAALRQAIEAHVEDLKASATFDAFTRAHRLLRQCLALLIAQEEAALQVLLVSPRTTTL